MTAEKKVEITFKDLGLSERVLEAINKKGFEEPSPVQALTIPAMLTGDDDIIAQAQTGTGKTAAFALPLVEMVKHNPNKVSALVLAPTRELAIQVAEEINSLKADPKLQVLPVYGGQSIDQQRRRLKKGVDIVVGTPGRVIDHINRKTLKLENIEYLILDEADEMLNMGFVEDMEEIIKYTNEDKRMLLFSATMPEKIKKLARKYMGEYKLISIEKKQLTTNLTEQIYYEVKQSDKFEALCRLIDIEEDFYGLVFCKTKLNVDSIVSKLNERGYDSDAIHGDISQGQREKTLQKFKKKNINILVATDVAARGIDVNNLTHVVNYAIPHDPEAYVHRIGRTGRAGNQGIAITFITPSEYSKLMFIKRVSKTDIQKSTVPKVAEIIKAKKKKIDESLAALGNAKVDEKYYNWAKTLLEEQSPTEVLAKILCHSFSRDLDAKLYNEINDIGQNRKGRGKGISMEGRARLFIGMGKSDKMNHKKLVDFIIKNTGVKNSMIDEVAIMNNFSFVTVPFKEAEIILKVFKKRAGSRPPLIVKAKKGR